MPLSSLVFSTTVKARPAQKREKKILQRVRVLRFLLFFKIILATWDPLKFLTNLGCVFLLQKKGLWDVYRDRTESVVFWGTTDIYIFLFVISSNFIILWKVSV